MKRLVAPAGVLLVPLVTIGAQRLQTFGAGFGVEPAERQCVPGFRDGGRNIVSRLNFDFESEVVELV